MFRYIFIVAVTVAPLLASDCPTTLPSNPPFVPSAPYAPNAERFLVGSPNAFWYGASALWTRLQLKGSWHALPHDADGYGQKLFLWSESYDPRKEPSPDLVVTGRRLDGAPTSFMNIGENPTHANFNHRPPAMLVGVTIPTAGCWEITSRYRGHNLTFVVAVTP